MFLLKFLMWIRPGRESLSETFWRRVHFTADDALKNVASVLPPPPGANSHEAAEDPDRLRMDGNRPVRFGLEILGRSNAPFDVEENAN